MRVSAQRRRLPLLADLRVSPRFSPACDLGATRDPPSVELHGWASRRPRRVVEDARNPRLRRHVSHLPARLPLYRRSCRHGAADSPSRPTSVLQRALTDTRNPPSGRRVSRLSVRCCGCEVGSVSPFSREGGKP
jgi:hypothetical protein